MPPKATKKAAAAKKSTTTKKKAPAKTTKKAPVAKKAKKAPAPKASPPALKASVALQAATVLRDVVTPDVYVERDELKRYLERVAAPAVARSLVYNFDDRYYNMYGSEFGLAPNWFGRDDDKNRFMDWLFDDDGEWFGMYERVLEEDVLARELKDVPKKLKKAQRKDALMAAASAMVADDARWLAFSIEHLNDDTSFEGFAGYEKESNCDAEFVRALPERVMKALASKPAKKTTDLCAFLRAAHGVDALDDVELAMDARPAHDDPRVPSTTLVLASIQHTSCWLNGSQTHGIATSTYAYVPSFDTGRPVPVQSVIYTFDHGRCSSEANRAGTRKEACAMGPNGSGFTKPAAQSDDSN